jgi:hypothetical protein
MRWRESASGNILPGISEERFLRAARDYVASGFPNPDRIGCPGRERLEVLACHKSVPDQDDIDHVMTCSECFIEYHIILKARKRKRKATVGILVAAALAAMVVSAIFLSRHQPAPVPIAPAKTPVEVAQEQVRKAVINLRPFERIRGESGNSTRSHPSAPVLDRANLLVTIQLPIGSPEGQYFFQLLDSNSSPRVEASGNAAIRDYVTEAEAPFDLRAVSAGRYTLTVRRAAEVASASYIVEVR